MIRAFTLCATLIATSAGAEGCGAFLAVLDGSGDMPDATCKQATTTDGDMRHCSVVYPYRAAAAHDHFISLADTVTRCLPNATPIAPAPGVNHPDTHLIRRFAIDGGEITVSLKDKSQLGQTLVFLQIFPNAAPQQ